MNTNNNHIVDLDLIIKYFAGEASELEQQAVDAWITSDIANKLFFNDYKKLWKHVEQVSAISSINTEDEWKALQIKINNNTKSAKLIPLNSIHNIYIKYARIAAILLIGLLVAAGIFYIINKQNYNQLVAYNSSTDGTLPDGSLVTLNSNSQLKYPKKFDKHKRQVSLQGEAFFTVIPNKTQPFIIEAQNATIEVLGTSFYVNTNDKHIEIIVSTGVVSVSNKKNTKKILLNAGEKGILDKITDNLSKTTNDDVNFLAWKTKRLIFKQDKLSRIIKTLNKVYNTNITFNSEISDCRFTAEFENQPLSEVLNVMKAIITEGVVEQQENNSIKITGKGC